jgi:AcrR family transcriptional regulator
MAAVKRPVMSRPTIRRRDKAAMPIPRQRRRVVSSPVERSVRAVQQRASDTRNKIVTAALETFAERGFEGARTRDIAARAGVNQGLITYHFSSKEQLWKASADRIFALLAKEFGSRLEALKDVDPVARLRAVVRQFVRFAAAHPELHRFMVEEGKNDGPRLQWLVDRHVRPLYEASRELVEAAQREGALLRIDPVHLHYILIGAATHLFVMAAEVRRLTGDDPMRKDMIEAHADAVVSLLLGATQFGSRRRKVG